VEVGGAAKLDRNKPVLVHCDGGRRSTKCLPELQALGFTQLIPLGGGLSGWEKAGHPATR
jgi:rhodanese-related sulfurtransferase